MYQQPQNMMMPPQQVNENKFEREFENYPVNQQIRNPAVANGQQKLKSNKNKYFQNNNIINNNDYQGNNNNATNEELQNMKNLILKLQNDLAQKDNIIQNQKEEKLRLTKRVDELERMLSTFLAMDKGN